MRKLRLCIRDANQRMDKSYKLILVSGIAIEHLFTGLFSMAS